MIVRVLGAAPMAEIALAATRNRVRAVAYHDVPRPDAFATQLDWIADRFTTVTGRQMADALNGGARLPKRAIWLTFDDGDVSVIRAALPLLQARGMVATAFVCGAWVGSTETPWWVTLAAARKAGLVRPDDVGATDPVAVRLALKRADDALRREVIAALAARLEEAGATPAWEQWTGADLAAWEAAGNDVGNHSWDHPVLDRCSADEQRRQVRLAHDRLSEIAEAPIDVFAWPNGDPAAAALDEARALGYRLVAECDHRLTNRRSDPMRVSRLRLDTFDNLGRTRSVLSGWHSGVFHLRERLRGRQSDDAVT